MRIYIVDDEEPARQMLRYHLKKLGHMEVIGAEGNPIKALEAINEQHPELVFLDIEMPVLNGFEMLQHFTCEPIVIFCTAYNEYAIRAFEVNALDFLVKPVGPERLRASLERATNEWQKLRQLKHIDGKPLGMEKIVVHQGRKYKVIPVGDIYSFTREGKYTSLFTKNSQEYLIRESINQLEEKMKNPIFFRISRSQLINRGFVATFKYLESGIVEFESQTGDSFQVSKRRIREFREWLD